MVHKEKAKTINNFLIMLDVFIALISFNLAIYINLEKLFILYNKDSVIYQLLILIIWTLIGGSFKNSILYRSRPYSMVLVNIFGQVFAGITLLILSAWSLNILHIGLSHLVAFGIINLILAFTVKTLIYYFYKRARKKGRNSLDIILIADNTGCYLTRQILNHPEWGYKISYIISSTPEEFSNSNIPVLSSDTNLEEFLRGKTIDEVIYCNKDSDTKLIEEYINICNDLGIVFRMYSPFFNMLTNKTQIQYFGTTPLLTISTTPMDYVALQVKRLFDIAFSLMVLLALSPLFLILAVIIKIDSPGKIFFKQKRVGLRGRNFYVYKFRTMVSNAEELKEKLSEQNEMDGPVFKMVNDPRITKIGGILRKYSIDELPQFFNVLKGEMSVIGPRPPIPKEVLEYERWQLRRLSMRPGLSCIWQVSGRNEIPFEEWMKMDLEYIDNWSLKLDIVLLLKTVRTVLKGDGR